MPLPAEGEKGKKLFLLQWVSEKSLQDEYLDTCYQGDNAGFIHFIPCYSQCWRTPV